MLLYLFKHFYISYTNSKLLFQLIDKRYEKCSTIITTNINFAKWYVIFGDPVKANTIMDIIMHHADVIRITGKSYGLKEHLTFNIK